MSIRNEEGALRIPEKGEGRRPLLCGRGAGGQGREEGRRGCGRGGRVTSSSTPSPKETLRRNVRGGDDCGARRSELELGLAPRTGPSGDEESEDLLRDEGEREMVAARTSSKSLVGGALISAQVKGRLITRRRIGEAGLASGGGGRWRCAKQAVSDLLAGGSGRCFGQPWRAVTSSSVFNEAWTTGGTTAGLSDSRERATKIGRGLGESYRVDARSSLSSLPSLVSHPSPPVLYFSTSTRFGHEEALFIDMLSCISIRRARICASYSSTEIKVGSKAPYPRLIFFTLCTIGILTLGHGW